MVGENARTDLLVVGEPPGGGPGGGRGGGRVPRSGRFTALAFLAPYLLLFSVFVLAPALYGLWISLHDWDYLLNARPFVGLDNYRALIDADSPVFEDFWMAMRATAIFTVT